MHPVSEIDLLNTGTREEREAGCESVKVTTPRDDVGTEVDAGGAGGGGGGVWRADQGLHHDVLAPGLRDW